MTLSRTFYLLCCLDGLFILGRYLVGGVPAPALFTSALVLLALVLFRLGKHITRLMVAIMAVVSLSQLSQLGAALTGYAQDPHFIFANLGVMVVAIICARVTLRKAPAALPKE